MSDDFVELVGNMGEGLGLSGAACRLYALLYIRGKPLSLDRMAGELEISKGSVSVNIRNLERWEAVRKVWKKGSRKDYYRAEEDIERILLKRIREGGGRRLDALSEYIESNRGGDGRTQLKKLEKRLEKARNLLGLLG